MSATTDKALNYFSNNCNCGQSVFVPFCEKYGLDEETALKIASGLGGGMRMGEICGVVSGAVLVIGLKYGQKSPEDLEGKKLCGEKAAEFLDEFRKRYGEVTCRGILGCDTSTPEGREQASREQLTKKICPGKVSEAVELLEELGY